MVECNWYAPWDGSKKVPLEEQKSGYAYPCNVCLIKRAIVGEGECPCDGEKCIFQQNKKLMEKIRDMLRFHLQDQSEWETGYIDD